MKRFVFGLESVLRWRASQFEEQQTRLRALLAERDGIRLHLRELEELRRDAESALLDAAAVTGRELAAWEGYRRRLRAERARWERTARECEERIGRQREQLLEARRRVRLLERLKERRYAEWEGEAVRELETLATESFLARFKRGG